MFVVGLLLALHGLQNSWLVIFTGSTMIARTENQGASFKHLEVGRGGRMQFNSINDTYS